MQEPTPPHRFYSETREGLGGGPRATHRRVSPHGVRASGYGESIGLKAGEHRVYNLEVEQEHQFYVGESGVLVHNAYGRTPSPRDPVQQDL